MVLMLLGYAVSALALDDPTRPPGHALPSNGKTANSPAAWRVSEIVIAAERRHAVINGQRLRVGDGFLGARVVAIQPDGVHLQSRTRRWVLPLLSESIHKKLRAER